MRVFPLAVLIFVVLLGVGVKLRSYADPASVLSPRQFQRRSDRVAALHCNPVIMTIKALKKGIEETRKRRVKTGNYRYTQTPDKRIQGSKRQYCKRERLVNFLVIGSFFPTG